ncbi:unnamed protein product [Clavelina lepadiformis]|uniref:ATP synthase F0 subunit 8 n=1 Tax=Clavelina lepadiformis TaxID=159417 RepID=A0ABP0GQQ4_CLALP
MKDLVNQLMAAFQVKTELMIIFLLISYALMIVGQQCRGVTRWVAAKIRKSRGEKREPGSLPEEESCSLASWDQQ